MRSGKRWLAGAAAGALGAGLLTVVATAPAANAAAATQLAFQYPSVTIVGDNLTASQTAINTPLYLLDAAGDPADSMANLAVEVTVTNPSTLASTDDTFQVATQLSGGTAGRTITFPASGAGVAGPLALAIRPKASPAGITWDSVVNQTGAVGTYTITARLYNTNSGATVSTATLPVSVIKATANPTVTFNFLNGDKLNNNWTSAAATPQSAANANIVNRLSGTAGGEVGAWGTSATNDTFYVWPSTSTGGPIFMATQYLSFGYQASTTAGGQGGFNVTGGFTSGDGTIAFGDSDTTWATNAASSVLSASFYDGTGDDTQTSTTAVQIASIAGSTAVPSVILSNTTQYQQSTSTTANPLVYEVPTGTTNLAFSVTTAGTFGNNNTDDSTMQFSAVSSVFGPRGGTVTNAGGKIAIRQDAGTLALTLNAAATAADETAYVYVNQAGAGQKQVQIAFRDPTGLIDAVPELAKISTTSNIVGTITDQFGAVIPGTWAITLKDTGGVCSSTSIATATATATGAFSIAVPAAYARTSAGQKTFEVCASNGFTTVGPTDAVVTYTATGGVTSLTATPVISTGATLTLPVVQVPGNGVVNTTTLTSQAQSESTTLTAATIQSAGTAFEILPNVSPSNTPIVFTGSEGVYFTKRLDGSIFWSDGTTTTSTTSATASGTTPLVAVYATKPGIHTVTLTSGSTTATIKFKAGVSRGTIRTITADPTKITLAPSEFKALSVVAKDIFGNPVPDDTSITASLAGGGTTTPPQPMSTGALTTDAAGKVTVYYTAPLGSGTGKLFWTANTYVAGAIAGAPAAAPTASADITVGGSGSKSIVIAGSRGTVSGKPGIIVDGSTTGFDVGSKMVPSIRFPGQSEYTVGSARPTTSVAGDFTWQRKTGKKIYVFFSNEAGDVKSNRIIIAAN